MSEHAKSLLVYGPPELYTAAEAEYELDGWEAVDSPYVLAMGGGSGGYFGMHGSRAEIAAVLRRALEQVDRSDLPASALTLALE
ncbi:hypothetical protein [Amycolatopsis sp. WGS_07]|uniref:hypothetical protein n=1 Tax=Amycolatopsis sp. WGS_07 TaxID=3076764 RepID=UPI0038732E2A